MSKKSTIYSLLSEDNTPNETPVQSRSISASPRSSASFFDPVKSVSSANEGGKRRAKLSLSEIMNSSTNDGARSPSKEAGVASGVIRNFSTASDAAASGGNTDNKIILGGQVLNEPKSASSESKTGKDGKSSTPSIKVTRNPKSPRKVRKIMPMIKKNGTGKLTLGANGIGTSGSLIRQGSGMEGSETDIPDGESGEGAGQKDPQLPIISIDVPVAPPGVKTTDQQITYNVASLCEDKYGFNALNSNSRLPVDLDDDLDDEMDEDDDDVANNSAVSGHNDAVSGPLAGVGVVNADEEHDDAADIVNRLHLKFTPEMTDEEKEEMVLKELHRRRMEDNKRIGKYDIDDPFIDDEELQFEEQTKNNKGGFFVYHGEWTDSDQTNNRRRGGNSSKRRSQTSRNAKRRRTSPSSRSHTQRGHAGHSQSSRHSSHGHSSNHSSRSHSVAAAKTQGTVKIAPKVVPQYHSSKSKPHNSTKTNEPKAIVVGTKKPVIASSSTSNNKIIIGSFPIGP